MDNNYKQWCANFKRFFEETSNYREFPAIKDIDYEKSENKAWYLASSGMELLRFYQTNYGRDRLPLRANQFYYVAFKNILQDESETNKIKMVPIHVDLATQISKTMCKLVFPSKPIISVNIDESVNKEEKEKEYELNDILEDNKFDNWIQDAAEKLSYSGAIAIKFNIDKNESDYPIMEVYPKEDFEVMFRYGNRLQVIAFKDYYKGDDKKDYCLYSIYGKGFIDYKLYRVTRRFALKEEVPLTTLAQTANLHTLHFYNKDGSEYNKILAVYMENKTGAISDYSGCIDEFMTLDEIRSNLVRFLRSSKVKTYIHDNLLAEDSEQGAIKVPDDYDMDTILIRDSNPNWTSEEMKRDMIDINNTIQGYRTAYEDILLQVLTCVGLSPATMGFDISGANSSGLALEIRERTTLHTREDRLQRWQQCLKDMSRLLLLYNGMTVLADNTSYIVPDDIDTLDFSIMFAEYGRSTTELVDDLVKRLDAQLIDLKTAYQLLYPQLSEDERAEMVSLALGLLDENNEPDVPKDNSDIEITNE